MKRPIESDYTSHVAYARALEDYCDLLRQPAQQEPVQPDAWESEMRSELAKLGFEGQCPESIGITIKSWFDAYAESLTAQPAQQEPVAWLENLKRLASICPELNMVNYSEEDVDDLNCWAIEVATCIDSITTPPAAAQPAVPDAVCREGWNAAIEAAADNFELEDGHYYDEVRESILKNKK
jgi:hypothetical protein